ncbi:MAG: glycosyltransferase family 9 protein [Alphaproteobacteria bacterium]
MWITASGIVDVAPRARDPDPRPSLVYVTTSGLGDLIVALPLLVRLREHYRAVPIIQRRHAEFARLLQRDGLLEDPLPMVSGLRLRSDPAGTVDVIRHVNRIRPEVTLIYGKPVLVLAAIVGLLRSESVIHASPARGPARLATRFDWRLGRFSHVASSGNRACDQSRFAGELGHGEHHGRWNLSRQSRDRLFGSVASRLPGEGYVVVAPWAGDPRRSAPLHIFKSCIEVIVGDAGLPVVITGTAEHKPQVAELIDGVPGSLARDLVGETDIPELLGILHGAKFLLANDSGSMHMATLVDLPSVIVFGPTTPDMILPTDRRATITSIQLDAKFRRAKPHRVDRIDRAPRRGDGIHPHVREVLLNACR